MYIGDIEAKIVILKRGIRTKIWIHFLGLEIRYQQFQFLPFAYTIKQFLSFACTIKQFLLFGIKSVYINGIIYAILLTYFT